MTAATRQPDLLEPQAAAERPATWRAPDRPREEACRVCGGAAPCGYGEAWFCVAHAPAGYWPAGRADA